MQLSWLSGLTTTTLTGNTSSAAGEALSFGSRFAKIKWSSWSVDLPYLYYQLLVNLTETLEHILYACLVYIIVCLGIYKLQQHGRWLKRIHFKSVKLQKNRQRILFVISHPDDECMFFGPLIYTLTQQSKDCQPYVLCLSNGNYENKAELRREELWRSCKVLGIPSSNVMLVNATELPDDPKVKWKSKVVSNLILYHIEALDIEAVFTFDREGVSHHPNHCAVYNAAAILCLTKLLPKNCKIYALDSINVLRKYLSILDLICTCIMSSNWVVLNWSQAATIRRAMLEHKSQMKWFRWLYIYFSRYMLINSFREVSLGDVELEMQIHDD